MKKLAYVVVSAWFLTCLAHGIARVAHAAQFFCSSGDVTCLIAAINDANGTPGENVINLESGIYTLQTIIDADTGLPIITGSIRVQAPVGDSPTVIERAIGAPRFRIFRVASGGRLTVAGVILQRGFTAIVNAGAILNFGTILLQDSVVTDSDGNAGAIVNFGDMTLVRSTVDENGGEHDAGGITNNVGATLTIDSSTIARNSSIGVGGIFNRGTLSIKNSSIVLNSTDQVQAGGGIANFGGIIDIVSSTIAKNTASNGGGLHNVGGTVSITNSTIRENEIRTIVGGGHGGGIAHSGGILNLQNTIVAGNKISQTGAFNPGVDCSGAVTSLGNNLVGDPTDCNISLQSSDLTGDPGLDSLVGTGEQDPPGKAYYPVLTGSVVRDQANSDVCPETDQLGAARIGTCDIGAIEFQGPVPIFIDVKPRVDPNKINPNSTRIINVAVFSAGDFDAATVQPETVRFGATGTEAAPVAFVMRDRNRDHRRDLILRFLVQDMGIQCGDTSASLTGQLANGLPIVGSSGIITAPCKRKK